MNSNLIHFNERKRTCFDRVEQKEVEMSLQYELFCVEVNVCQCLQQVNNLQSIAIKVNSIIIIKKLFFSKNERSNKKSYDEKC